MSGKGDSGRKVVSQKTPKTSFIRNFILKPFLFANQEYFLLFKGVAESFTKRRYFAEVVQE